MEPRPSPDYSRPSPGLARFWQVRPEADAPALPPAAEAEADVVALGSRRATEALETPADLLTGSPLAGTFGAHPLSPLVPVASAARNPGLPGQGPNGERRSADPFGLNRAAGRTGSRNPGGGRPSSGPPARSRHGDTDHSVPTEDQPEPVQDVKSQEPEAGDTPAGREGTFGGFVLGGRRGGAGRFLFGGRNDAGSEDADRHSGEEEHPDEPESAAAEDGGPGDSSVAEPGGSPVAEPGGSPVAGQPGDEQSAADQDAADVAEPSDENGREDMNGRAGAPGYAQTGEASGPDGKPVPAPPGLLTETGEEPSAAPADPPRPVAGWAAVPGVTQPVTPTSAGPATGPVSGAPVSPGYGSGAFGAGDFTPDHPAATLEPVSGAPEQSSEPADPAATAPVSPAQAPGVTLPSVQIPATRTPPDLAVDRIAEPPENGGYAGLPQSPDGAFGFSPAGYSLGRSGDAFGVASVTPAPQSGSPVPPPPEFQAFPGDSMVTGHSVGGATRRALDEGEEPQPAPRRSASLEDVEPVRRAGRRGGRADEPAPIAELSAEKPQAIGRTIWDEDAARHFRAAWHEVKAEFVDDPVNALTRAHDLLTDAVNELTEVLLAERDELDPLRGTDTPDTESMRMAMRGYREFLDRILSL